MTPKYKIYEQYSIPFALIEAHILIIMIVVWPMLFSLIFADV